MYMWPILCHLKGANYLQWVSSFSLLLKFFIHCLLPPPSLQSFKLEHPSSGEVVYAGVLEFNSPTPESAYLPQWMMDHLGAKEGEEMKFEHVELPKGKFVRLQPVSSAWLVSGSSVLYLMYVVYVYNSTCACVLFCVRVVVGLPGVCVYVWWLSVVISWKFRWCMHISKLWTLYYRSVHVLLIITGYSLWHKNDNDGIPIKKLSGTYDETVASDVFYAALLYTYRH